MKTIAFAIVGAVTLWSACATSQEAHADDRQISPPPQHSCVSFDSNIGILELVMSPSSLGSHVVLNGILFRSKDSSKAMTLHGRGSDDSFVLFHDTGMEVVFSRLAASVTLKVFQGATPFSIVAIDSNGDEVDSRNINMANGGVEIVHLVSTQFSIARIIITGGGNEGGVAFTCALLQG